MITRRQLIAAASSTVVQSSIQPAYAQATKRFIAQGAHLTVDLPAHWSHKPSLPGGITTIGADDGFFNATPMTSGDIDQSFLPFISLDTNSAKATLSAVFGEFNPARYTMSATDDNPAATLLIMDNPNPVLTTTGEADRLMLVGDPVHFDAIVTTLRFGLDDVSAPDLANSILDILEAHAFYSQEVNWRQLRIHANDLDCHADIEHFLQSRALSALRSAGDRHSWILPLTNLANTATPIPDMETPNLPTGRILNGSGYLAFPVHNAFGSDYLTDYARTGSELRNDIAEAGVCGWIIDLRAMGGGSITPLLTVLYPFLPQGKLAGFVDAHGDELWIIRSGNAIDPVAYNVDLPEFPWPEGLDDPNLPVAVLTGSGNASAGEFVQLALMSRPNTTSFGLPTAGYTTGNVAFPLFTGSSFALATTAAIDRNGNIYTSSIDPDVVDPAISLPDRLSDEVLAPVYDWLGASCMQK